MDKNVIEQTIASIVNKKTPVYFVSPHLDDTILSAGGLIEYLSTKTKVTVITVFTESTKKQSLSARQFLKQCGYLHAQALFEHRRKEDKQAGESLHVTTLHLGFRDALWREKKNVSPLQKILGSFAQEAKLVYPTYRFHVQKGIIAKEDVKTIDDIGKRLQEIIPGKSVVFAPLGMGKHVDHLVTKEAVKKFFKPFYWFDQPYMKANEYKQYQRYPFIFTPKFSQEFKKNIVSIYKTQTKALFGTEKIPDLPEYFVSTDIMHRTFPLCVNDYYFVRQLERNDGKGKYLYGLYANEKGSLGFAKQWNGTIKNKNYIFLKNEEFAYRMLTPITEKISREESIKNIDSPRLLMAKEDKYSYLLLLEYREGENLLKSSVDEKTEALGKAFDYLEEINKNIPTNKHSEIFNRGIGYLSLQFPFILIIACLRHPHYMATILRAAYAFLFHIPFLIKHKRYGFVHRDIGEKNILVSKAKVTLHDFQLSCYADVRVDLATMYLKSVLDKNFSKAVFSNVIKEKISNPVDARVFFMYCLYFALYEASMLNNKEVVTTIKFINIIFAHMHGKSESIVAQTTHSPEQKKVGIVQKAFATMAIIIVVLPLLFAVVKGEKGNPLYYQTERITKFGGPFELSISAGRFALTEAIVKYHSLFLTYDLAKFSAPDVAEYRGRFISLFTPGVSFLGVPFYLLGMPFHMPQLSTYMLNVILGILIVFLLTVLGVVFGTNYKTGLLGGLIFLFATNALAYTSSFTQHFLTIAIMLSMLVFAYRKQSHFSALSLGLLYGFGAMVDIPNIFMFFPILIYAVLQLISTEVGNKQLKFSVKMPIISLILGIIFMIGIFAWYNYATTGSVTKIAQLIGQTGQFKPAQQNQITPATQNIYDIKIGLSLPFKTRAELFGMYILLFSDERSWLFYCPIVLLGFLGLIFAYRNKLLRGKSILIISLISSNILLYSMFGDPWGGWAFGSRYLLPSAALLCTFVAVAFARYRRNIPFILLIIVLTAYSLRVSLLGALTTIAIPPKVEAVHLLHPVPYTYQYNQNLINQNYTSSLVYNLFLYAKISVKNYFFVLYAYCTAVIVILMAWIIIERRKHA